MRVVIEQVEVVVRTLKLVLRSFQRSWMRSEQSSSEQVNAALLIDARVDGDICSSNGTLEGFPRAPTVHRIWFCLNDASIAVE